MLDADAVVEVPGAAEAGAVDGYQLPLAVDYRRTAAARQRWDEKVFLTIHDMRLWILRSKGCPRMTFRMRYYPPAGHHATKLSYFFEI